MAKKTFEQLTAEADKLKQQLKDIEDSKAAIAGEEADEQRKLVDDALAKYNGLAIAAGKPELFLAPHTGKQSGGKRGPKPKSSKPADYTADQKNAVIAHLQKNKGKAVKGSELSKLIDGYSGITAMLSEEIGSGTIKADGPARGREFTYHK